MDTPVKILFDNKIKFLGRYLGKIKGMWSLGSGLNSLWYIYNTADEYTYYDYFAFKLVQNLKDTGESTFGFCFICGRLQIIYAWPQ